MAEARKPQDHKKKTKDPGEFFELKHRGEIYTFKSVELMTPGFLRKNRKLDQVDQMFTAFELLCDDETLAVIDEMSKKEFNKLNEDFWAFVEAQPGE